MKETVKYLILTSRPIFWLMHLTAFIFGASASGNFSILDIKNIFALIIFTLPLSFIFYGINDYYDSKGDDLNDRKGGVYGLQNQIKKKQIIFRYSFVFSIAILLASLVDIKILLLLAFSLVCPFLYGAPPFRMKSIPILDSLIGGGLYAFVLALVGFYLYKGAIIDSSNWLPFVVIFIGGFTFHALATVLDYIPDRKVGDRTSAVFFGPQIVVIYTLVLNFIGLLLTKGSAIPIFVFTIFVLISIAFLFREVREKEFMRKAFPVIFLVFTFVGTFIISIINSKLFL